MSFVVNQDLYIVTIIIVLVTPSLFRRFDRWIVKPTTKKTPSRVSKLSINEIYRLTCLRSLEKDHHHLYPRIYLRKAPKTMPRPSEKPQTLPVSGSKSLVADLGSSLAVIVTHPWGPLGGNMHNNVVLGIVLWFQRLGITTMRFDFCGSQIGRGYAQVDQVKEAANFLLNGAHQQPQQDAAGGDKKKMKELPKYIFLVGYSYGSIISASASVSIPRCVGVMSIAPPLAVRHWLYLFHGNYHLEQSRKRKDLPRLLVIGSEDNFTGEPQFMDIVKTMPQPATTGAVLKGADHFFRGREKDLMDILGQWILSSFPQCRGDLRNLSTANFVIIKDESLSSPPETSDLGYNNCSCGGELGE